jgi:hypothetical protein
MDNKQLFIDGYLERISEQFGTNKDTAFEIFSIVAITECPFQKLCGEHDRIQVVHNFHSKKMHELEYISNSCSLKLKLLLQQLFHRSHDSYWIKTLMRELLP